jgi:hypothetical protein
VKYQPLKCLLDVLRPLGVTISSLALWPRDPQGPWRRRVHLYYRHICVLHLGGPCLSSFAPPPHPPTLKQMMTPQSRDKSFSLIGPQMFSVHWMYDFLENSDFSAALVLSHSGDGNRWTHQEVYHSPLQPLWSHPWCSCRRFVDVQDTGEQGVEGGSGLAGGQVRFQLGISSWGGGGGGSSRIA